jgi:predicted amino acid racemase
VDATSDHLILDVEPPHPPLIPGQEVVLQPYYRAMVAACASDYVEKVFLTT